MSGPERSVDAHELVAYRRRHVDLLRVGSAMCRRCRHRRTAHRTSARKVRTDMSRKPRTPIDLAATALRLAAAHDLWQPLVDFDPVSRYYARLASDPDHEAWLLTWLPGQGTDWHDHGNSAGSFVVLQGRLTEQTASSPDAHGTRRILPDGRGLASGSQRSFGHSFLHRVTNTSLDPAVSLHVYSPRLVSMRTYAVNGDRLHLAELQRAGAAW